MECQDIILQTAVPMIKLYQVLKLQSKNIKYIFIGLLFFIIIIYLGKGVLLLHTGDQDDLPKNSNDISCHNIIDDSLPSADNLTFPEKSIFFLETSCRGTLNSRQACSVESAAKANPNWRIIVLFTGPVYKSSLNKEPLKTLQTIKNVQFARIYKESYSENTALAGFFTRKAIVKSKFRVLHTSDALRFLTLFKYGGVYLDLDVVVIKSFENLPKNFVVQESRLKLGSYVIALSRDEIGKGIAKACMRNVADDYHPNLRNWNGPLVLHEILSLWCGTKYVKKMTLENCKGFKVFEEQYFSPIHYEEANIYFNPVKDDRIINDEILHHIWNDITRSIKKVPEDSLYGKLARTFCSFIYNIYGDNFGI